MHTSPTSSPQEAESLAPKLDAIQRALDHFGYPAEEEVRHLLIVARMSLNSIRFHIQNNAARRRREM